MMTGEQKMTLKRFPHNKKSPLQSVTDYIINCVLRNYLCAFSVSLPIFQVNPNRKVLSKAEFTFEVLIK